MANQYFLGYNGPIFAVLVDENQGEGVRLAQANQEDGIRTRQERLAAMKRLWLKMVDQYPKADVDLVEIVPIDATTVDGEIPVDAMSVGQLRREVSRLRAKR